MPQPKPTATADVEFGITGAKSRQTNHGPAHGYEMSFNHFPTLLNHRRYTHFPLNCYRHLRLICTCSVIYWKMVLTNKPVTNLTGKYSYHNWFIAVDFPGISNIILTLILLDSVIFDGVKMVFEIILNAEKDNKNCDSKNCNLLFPNYWKK